METEMYAHLTNAELQRLLTTAPDDIELLREIARRFTEGYFGYTPTARRSGF